MIKKTWKEIRKNQLAIDFYLLSILCIYYLKFSNFSNQAIIFFCIYIIQIWKAGKYSFNRFTYIYRLNMFYEIYTFIQWILCPMCYLGLENMWKNK